MPNERYIAFDVETPNAKNDRISSIGIAVIENGSIVETKSTLVDPETYFNRFNIELTGITPEMTEGAPNFRKLWGEIGELMQSGILLAHNAPFDMRVLSKCLNDYGIAAPRYFSYACTCLMGKRCYPELPNHKLNTMCERCGITLDHHKADSDSLACASLFLDYIDQGLTVTDFIRRYDTHSLCTLK